MRKIPQWEFDFYALSLPRGHGFGDEPPVGAWGRSDGLACGIITRNVATKTFGTIVMRRRVDSVWTITERGSGFGSMDAAVEALEPSLAEGIPPEPVPSGLPVAPRTRRSGHACRNSRGL